MATDQPTRASGFALSAAAIVLGTSLLTGCSVTAVTTDPSTGIATVSLTAEEPAADETETDAETAAGGNADTQDWDAAAAVTITMTPDGTTADGGGVSVDGSTVTITDTGTYVLRGALTGQVIVAAPAGAVVALVLDGTPAVATEA